MEDGKEKEEADPRNKSWKTVILGPLWGTEIWKLGTEGTDECGN